MKKLSTYFRTILCIAFLFFMQSEMLNACNNSDFAIDSQTDNPDGTTTYCLTLTVELGGLDASFYGFVVQFNSASNTPVVTSYPSTLSTADLIFGNLGDNLTGVTGSDINSIANDFSDWDQYLNQVNTLSYEWGGFTGAASDDISLSICITVDGCVEEILFDASVNSGSSSCEFTESTGISCSTPPPCNALPGDVIVSGATANGTNTYDIADGASIDLNDDGAGMTPPPADGSFPAGFGIALFDCDPTGVPNCDLNDPVTFGNSSLCPCFLGIDLFPTGDSNSGGESSSIPGNSTLWVMHITLDYIDNGPPVELHPDLDGDGCFESGPLVTLNYLPPEPCDCTNPVCGGMHWDCSSEAEADYNDPSSTATEYSFASPLPFTNGTSYTLCYEYTTGASETEVGFVNAVQYLDFFCDFDRVYHVYESTCGAEISSSGPADFGNDGLEYSVSSNTAYTFCVEVTSTTNDCQTLDDTYVWLYDASGGSSGCGTCSAPCTDSGMGSVDTYDDRTYSDCWTPECSILGPTSITNCFEVMTDATGFVGVVLGGGMGSTPADPFAICFATDFDPTWTLSDGCGATIPNPTPNVNGHSIGFNPEYTGLTPNNAYVLCVTVEIPAGCQMDSDNFSHELCMDYYGTDCTANLEGTSEDGFSCKDDGIELATTINWIQTAFDAGPNADGTETTGFLVFCDPPVLPMTQTYAQANSLAAILEADDSIGDLIDNNGDYVDPFTGEVCSDEIYLVPITISQIVGGSFIVDWDCFDTDDIVQVDLGLTPMADATANPSTICAGESSELTATGGGTYEWSNGLGTNPVVTVTPTTTTTYTVTVTDVSGNCTDTAQVTVTVNDPGPEPSTECWETATLNNTTCMWDVTGTQPTEPTTECYETATFNDGTCVWDVTGTQPTEPTTACYETATFNDVTCIWDVTGTQPTEPTTECYETATFNDGTCVWDVTGTQPTEPTSACYETATFNDVTCIWDVTGTQPTEPTTECYETATFNDGTCVWDVTGTQPTEPTTECYETATFNDVTCIWDVTGTQPTEPATACYETATFNDVTCIWDVTGTQPTEPTTECYETATFNNGTCMWDVTGTQPTEPTTECYETATFNDVMCIWVVTGIEPTEPTTECYETATFNDVTCVWDVTGTQPTEPTGLECWETTSFNDATCVWDVTGTQPTEPTTECYETATFNDGTCIWDVIGTQPTEPTTECWETATFNDITCVWDVSGTQPTEPTTECWETATFNDGTCMWVVTGTQPTEPTTECYETAIFNDVTCIWDVTGTQPTEPTGLDCWETTTFNDATCVWDVTGSQPTEPTTECYETATFNDGTCIWDVTGTQPTEPTTECWETAMFNDVTCVWDVTGTQPTEPTTECWETATFNNATCIWVVTGTQPTEPTSACYEIATFNDVTCVWDVTGTQPTEPTTECWESTSFNDVTCIWDVTGSQPTEPTTECWETASFNNTLCIWEVSGNQPMEPSVECWETTSFNNITCIWDVSGTQPAAPIFTLVNTYCVGDTPETLPNMSDNGVSGTWNPIAISTTNPGTINYIFTPADGCTDVFEIMITINDCGCMDPAFVSIDPIVGICENENIDLTAILSGSATSLTWSTSGDGAFDNVTSINPTYTPGSNDIAAGNVTLSIITDDPDGAGPCAPASASTILTINTFEDPNFNIQNDYCGGDLVDMLPLMSNNGITGSWIPSTIDNMTSGAYIFTSDAGQCANDFTLNVIITPSNTPTFSITNTYCVDDAPDMLSTTSDNGVAGIWTPTSINTASAGTTNYLFTPTNSCDEALSLSVTVTDCGCLDPAFVTIDPINEICEDETLSINAVIAGSATSVTWSATGDGTFDNASAVNSIYTPGASDIANGVVTLSVMTDDPDGTGPCSAASTSILLVINNLSDPTFNLMSTYCAGDVVEILPATSNNSVAGTWSPSVIDDMNSGDYLFTPDAGQCANDFTLNVTITPSNTPTFSITNTYCVGDAADVLTTTSDNGVEGTWNPMNINTSSAGTANYFFTPTNSCDESFSISVTVTDCGCLDPAFVTIDPINEICANETLILNAMISGSATSITWSSAGDGAFDNATSTNPIYTPGAADITNGVVTLSVITDDPDGVDPCSAASTSILLVINNLSDPTFNLMSTYCAGDVVEILPTTSNNSVVGTWSPSVIDDMNSGEYLFTPDAEQCANDFTLNVIITPSNTPTFLITNTYCVGDASDVLSTTSDNGVEGTWNPMNINTSSAGTANYFFTPTNSCDESFSISVTVTDCGCLDPAFVTIDPINEICPNETLILNAMISGSATSVTWSSAGDGAFDNTTSTNPIYTPGAADITNGVVTLSVMTDDPDGVDPCSAASTSILLVINNFSDPTFNLMSTYCAGDVVEILPTTSNNSVVGTWSPSVIDDMNSGDYLFTSAAGQCANDFTLNVIITPSNTPTFSITNAYCVGDVTDVLSTTSDNGVEGTWTPAVIDATSSGATDYFFTPTNSCDETISISVSVMDCNCVDPAFVTIDPIGSICENQSIDLNAVISGSASSVTWTSTGDGTFDNTISLTPIYTPGPSDIIDGIVSLTVTTDDPDGADDCSAAASNISLNINELVDPIFMISDTFCIGTMVDVLSSTSDNGVNGSWSPSVIDNALSGTYVFTPNTNECANPYSISIIIDPCTTSECDLVLTTNVIDESCFGLNDGSVELMVTNGVEPITYTWNNNNLEGPNFDGLSPGTYTVNYNDAMGCTGLFTFEILEGSILTLEVTSDETLVPLNTEVNLTGSTNIPDDRIAQINWNISQGLDCQDCLETTAQILSSANYILTIVDVDGCTIQDSVLVDVIKIDPEIYFPNVFSPNGDADNQYFYPKGKNVEIISSLRIYDRWGNLIFENENFEPNDNSQGWDGTYQSKPLNPGVFVYIASYKGIAGFEGTMSGDITIIR